MSGARLDIDALGKNFRGLRAVHDVAFSVPAGVWPWLARKLGVTEKRS